MNQGLDEVLCGYLDKQQPRWTYDLKDQAQLKLGSLLHLRVVPWAGSGSAEAVEGILADDGTFRVEPTKIREAVKALGGTTRIDTAKHGSRESRTQIPARMPLPDSLTKATAGS